MVPRLVVRRLATFAVVLWAVYTLAFLMLYALPSDPVALMLERRSSGAGGSSPEQIELLRLRYGLNDPFWLRYLKGLGELLRGDLGTSFQSGRPVHDLLRVVAPNTLALAGSALALALPWPSASRPRGGAAAWSTASLRTCRRCSLPSRSSGSACS